MAVETVTTYPYIPDPRSEFSPPPEKKGRTRVRPKSYPGKLRRRGNVRRGR